jgi:hypothetical protein
MVVQIPAGGLCEEKEHDAEAMVGNDDAENQTAYQTSQALAPTDENRA